MRHILVLGVVLSCVFVSAFSQSGSGSEEALSGGPFIGGGALFNLDRDTSDLMLEMGGAVDFRVRDRLRWTGSAGFLANVSDNDAFDDRSVFLTSGLSFGPSSDRRFRPFVSTGLAYADGERACHGFIYGGGGIRHWYGESIGWQVEVRDYINGDLNFVQARLSILLR